MLICSSRGRCWRPVLCLLLAVLLCPPPATADSAGGRPAVRHPDSLTDLVSSVPPGWPADQRILLPATGLLELLTDAAVEAEPAAAPDAPPRPVLTLRWEQDYASPPASGGQHIHRITAGWCELPEDFDYSAEPDWAGLERLSHEAIGGNFEVFSGELPPARVKLGGREWRFADVNVYREAEDWSDPQDRLSYYSSKYCYVTLHKGRALFVNFSYSFFAPVDHSAQRAFCDALLDRQP